MVQKEEGYELTINHEKVMVEGLFLPQVEIDLATLPFPKRLGLPYPKINFKSLAELPEITF